jgi:hypothetical protein
VKSVTQENLIHNSYVVKYIQKCSELCWRMQITDPPLCLKFGLYLQLFVGGIMSYLRYLCLFPNSGVQHILCCAFVLLFFVLCTLRIYLVNSVLYDT